MSSVREKRRQVHKQQNREEERKRLGLEPEPIVSEEKPVEEPKAKTKVDALIGKLYKAKTKPKPKPKAKVKAKPKPKPKAKAKAKSKPKPKSGGKK